MPFLSNSKKKFLYRFLVDLFCVGLVATGQISIKLAATPYHRGFFCDDESIQHPFLNSTITSLAAGIVGACLPAAIIIFVEALFRKNGDLSIFTQSRVFRGPKSWIMSSYEYIVVFIFGMAVNQFLTDVGKYSIGRPRPHFLSVCQPDYSKINCTAGYITDYTCTNTDTALVTEARLSFPSGHSSFSMYCMMYLILYLQARFSCSVAPLLKPTLQLVFFAMGFFTCLSRISDYKHHWSDVLSGAILGMVVCFCVVRTLTDFGKVLFTPRTKNEIQLQQVLTEDTSDDRGLNNNTYSRPHQIGSDNNYSNDSGVEQNNNRRM